MRGLAAGPQAAEGLGLFAAAEPAVGAAIIAPALRETIERWFAVVFLMNGECARRALEEATRAPSADAA